MGTDEAQRKLALVGGIAVAVATIASTNLTGLEVTTPLAAVAIPALGVTVGFTIAGLHWIGTSVLPIGLLLVLFAAMPAAFSSKLLQPAPRLLFLAVERGTPAELAARDAGFIELVDAQVDTSRTSTATVWSFDNEGKASSETGTIAPIVTVRGEADRVAMDNEPVSFFACETFSPVSDGGGTIHGRLAPLGAGEKAALEKLRGRVQLAPTYRCVTRTMGGPLATTILWNSVLVLVAIVSGLVARFALRYMMRSI